MRVRFQNNLRLVLPALLFVISAWQGLAFYNPQAGRWLNRDPLEERGSANLYLSLRNSPVSMWDALGERCCLLTYVAWPYNHSAIKCDNGVYISAGPLNSQVLPGSPVEWREEPTDQKRFGPPQTVHCSSCLDESLVANWFASRLTAPPWYNGCTYNCTHIARDAIQAGLSPQYQVRPACACNQTVEDLLRHPFPISRAKPLDAQLTKLEANGCNRYRCVLDSTTWNRWHFLP